MTESRDIYLHKSEVAGIANDLCKASDSTLLYLVYFGSRLYGTSTVNSDTDVKGVFLPALDAVILGKSSRSLRYSTGDDKGRNCAADIDIELWSAGFWTQTLLPAGDTGAQDLLFSVSSPDCVIYRSSILDPVFNNPLKFIDLANNRAYAQYSLSQAKKYGIKGSRLGTIRSIWKWLETHGISGKLAPHIQELVNLGNETSHCFSKEIDGINALVLCGKVHFGGITLAEFKGRVWRDMEKYGARAVAAEKNQGIDFKALSHAMRALDQMEELLLTGSIKYPLAGREKLIKIKNGEIPWTDLEKMILDRLCEVISLHDKLAEKHTHDQVFAENFLLSCYGLSPGLK